MQARYSDVRLRLNGAAAIVCAGAAFYYYAIRPLEAARRGEPHIPFPREIILFGPMFVCYGAFFLIFGAKARDWTVRKDVSGQSKMTKLGGWLMLIIFIVGLSAAGWIYSLFTDLGYEFSARQRRDTEPKMKTEPNQSSEPTPTAGTSAAEQPLVPAAVVAHLQRQPKLMRAYVFYFSLMVVLANVGYALSQLATGKKEMVSLPLLLGSMSAAAFALVVVRRRLRQAKRSVKKRKPDQSPRPRG